MEAVRGALSFTLVAGLVVAELLGLVAGLVVAELLGLVAGSMVSGTLPRTDAHGRCEGRARRPGR